MLVLQHFTHGESDFWPARPVPAVSKKQGQIASASLHSITHNASTVFQYPSDLCHDITTAGVDDNVKRPCSSVLFCVF